MIDRKALLADLQRQVKLAETDLHAQVKSLPEVRDRLRAEYDAAFKLKRTAATWGPWLDERITQIAVAWVLGAVFLRFCEDNRLIPEPYLTAPDQSRRDLAQARYEAYVDSDSDPTYRGWLERAFAEIGEGKAARLLFDRRHNPLYQVPLSHDGAGALITFWRERDPAGGLIHDFMDPFWDTRFLGDLYQDLSERARKTYALLQTPEFVEEFILDRTMNPVIREMGESYVDLKMIDPTCGSGHFVLGAFKRLLSLHAERRPWEDSHERVRKALDAVHGVDINPHAVAIARFRLLIAAMAEANVQTLMEAAKYEWHIHLAMGDSLIAFRQLDLHSDDGDSVGELANFMYAAEDIKEHSRILDDGRYDVVVGNPPYVAVGDRALNEEYRRRYYVCEGTYALSIPFAQRFFELAKRGDLDSGRGYGLVGQITADSFMKREFGKLLVEEFFARDVELTEVIDTSGAYIPSHGIPTVILVGRARPGDSRSPTVRTVRSVQGEPTMPKDGEPGVVWRAIEEQIDRPGSVSQWVSVDNVGRQRYFAAQPWILFDGGLELMERVRGATSSTLRDHLPRDIGFASFPGQEDAFVGFPEALRRQGVTGPLARPLVAGKVVRDWSISSAESAITPYDSTFECLPYDERSPWGRSLWAMRTCLRSIKDFDGKVRDTRDRPWWSWYRWVSDRYRTPLSITYAEVATHNHFVVDRGGKVFNQTAPVIKFGENAPEERLLEISGLLNSSTACFWLRMMSMEKPSNGVGRGLESEKWTIRHQFSSKKVEQFPLPDELPGSLALAIQSKVRDLTVTTPLAIAGGAISLTSARLRDTCRDWKTIRGRLIALQEELDWQVYSLYRLLPEDLRAAEGDVPELALGERAFEIVLARRIEAGEAPGEWFKRHGSTPITEIPERWPEKYREVVRRRIEAIESSRAIGMIERPEYKRRWQTEGWDAMQDKALRSWLLDRMEDRAYWFDADGVPTILTCARLVDRLSEDQDFVSVAALYAPRAELSDVVTGLFADEHVPFLAALRYKPSGMRKRADWEDVWDLQRQEDAASDEPAKRKIRDSIPVPPKYAQADFLRTSYWKARGKLDVPKERFISYGTVNTQTPELYGWAGWDHREQAHALAIYFTDSGLTTEEITPFFAGLLELQPWLDQWHDEFHPLYGGSPARFFAGHRRDEQGKHGLTDDDLRDWRPAAATRGRRTKKS